MRDDADIRLEGFLPWHTELASAWLGARGRFAHAWLIHGAAGIGKMRFAKAAAVSLLCEAPQANLACGECQACRWLRAGNHPDYRVLRPDAMAVAEGAVAEGDEAPGADRSKKAPSREIRVEQVRALESWANTATHRGGARVVLLYPAQAMNLIAANALLKLLEEPPPNTLFLLVVDAPDKLLPTLVSRCRRLALPAPDAARSLQWLVDNGVEDAEAHLAACGGAPLAALRKVEAGEPALPGWLERWVQACAQGRAQAVIGRTVDELEKIAPSSWLDALQRAFFDLMLVHSGCPVRYHPKLAQPLTAIAQRAPAVAVAQTARWLASQQRIAAHPLNPRLFSHAVLLRVTAISA